MTSLNRKFESFRRIEIGPVAVILLEVKILRDHDRLSISKLQDNKSIFFVKHIEINLQKLKMDGQEPQKDVSFNISQHKSVNHVMFSFKPATVNGIRLWIVRRTRRQVWIRRNPTNHRSGTVNEDQNENGNQKKRNLKPRSLKNHHPKT